MAALHDLALGSCVDSNKKSLVLGCDRKRTGSVSSHREIKIMLNRAVGKIGVLERTQAVPQRPCVHSAATSTVAKQEEASSAYESFCSKDSLHAYSVCWALHMGMYHWHIWLCDESSKACVR